MTSEIVATKPVVSRRKNRTFLKNLRHDWLIHILIVFGLIVAFIPIALMLLISVKNMGQFITQPLGITLPFDWSNYTIAWNVLKRSILNSLGMTTVVVILSLAVSSLAAYSFSRFEYPGRDTLMVGTLSAQMFPWALLLISLYIFLGKLRLVNSYPGLILAHSIFALPLTIWIIKGYFDTVPQELEDAAIVDGCGPMQTLIRIIIPVCYPGILAAGIYVFIFSWNDFIFGLTLTSKEHMRTLGPGIALTFIGEHAYAWIDMMASSILVSLPTVVAFLLLQRFFIEGLTSGAVK